MKTYYIYHIPERRKIGVTYNLSLRMSQHKWTGSYEILEEHTCIYRVSDREKELQREYEYPVDDKPYWKVVRDGLIGLSNVKMKNRVVFDKEHQSNASKHGHQAKLKNGFYKKQGKKKRKLDMSDATNIRKLSKEGYKQRDIANEYGVSQRTVANIIHYRTYNV